jgi:hypothetical protein
MAVRRFELRQRNLDTFVSTSNAGDVCSKPARKAVRIRAQAFVEGAQNFVRTEYPQHSHRHVLLLGFEFGHREFEFGAILVSPARTFARLVVRLFNDDQTRVDFTEAFHPKASDRHVVAAYLRKHPLLRDHQQVLT